jgi:hypothetical protein
VRHPGVNAADCSVAALKLYALHIELAIELAANGLIPHGAGAASIGSY